MSVLVWVLQYALVGRLQSLFPYLKYIVLHMFSYVNTFVHIFSTFFLFLFTSLFAVGFGVFL